GKFFSVDRTSFASSIGDEIYPLVSICREKRCIKKELKLSRLAFAVSHSALQLGTPRNLSTTLLSCNSYFETFLTASISVAIRTRKSTNREESLSMVSKAKAFRLYGSTKHRFSTLKSLVCCGIFAKISPVN